MNHNGATMTTDLRAYDGKTVRLRFRDGQVVAATVVHVDQEDRAEIIYEVVEVIHSGREPLPHVIPGATLSAALADLQGIESQEA